MNDFEKLDNGFFMCKTCGEQVPSGIVNISGHWVECTGKGFTDALMEQAEKTNGKLDIKDVEDLREKYL